MRKLLTLGACALAFSMTPALADDYEGKKDRMFEKLDADDDGNITKAEFLSEAEEKFAKIDADGDGTVTKAEADEMRKKWHEKMKEHREKRKEMMEQQTESE